MLILAPSILSADFGNLRRDVLNVTAAGAQYVHIDVMDGMFVPNLSFGMPVIKSIRPCTEAVFDVHMMTEEPGRYAEAMKEAGADIFTVHQEACRHLDRTLAQIRDLGMKTGVALNPATPISVLDCVLDQVDMVLIMSVNPGFGNQRFIPYALNKVRALRERFRALGLETDIEVDGGVSPANARELMEAGANVLVAGSAVYKGDAAANVKEFLRIFADVSKSGAKGEQAQ